MLSHRPGILLFISIIIIFSLFYHFYFIGFFFYISSLYLVFLVSFLCLIALLDWFSLFSFYSILIFLLSLHPCSNNAQLLIRYFLFFLNIFIDYAITVVPFHPPLHSILPTPSLPNSPPIVHVHGSYL